MKDKPIEHKSTKKSEQYDRENIMMTIENKGRVKCRNCGDRITIEGIKEKISCDCGKITFDYKKKKLIFTGDPEYVGF